MRKEKERKKERKIERKKERKKEAIEPPSTQTGPRAARRRVGRVGWPTVES